MKKSALLPLLFGLGLTACGPSLNGNTILYYAHDFTDSQTVPYGTHCTVLQVKTGGHVGEVIQESKPQADKYLLDVREGIKPLTARCFEYVTQPDGTRVKTLTGETVINDTGFRNPTVYVGSSENVPASVIAKFKAQPNVTTSGIYPIVQFR